MRIFQKIKFFPSMNQNRVWGGLIFLKRGQPGGYGIHHWKRLVLYVMGKIAIKSKQQQHRGHERSFSVSTNPNLVFGHMTGFWCDCKLVTKISQGFQIRFFCCKLVYPLSRLRPGAVSSPPSMLPPLTSFCSPFCLSVAFQVGYSYCKKQSSWSTPWCLSRIQLSTMCSPLLSVCPPFLAISVVSSRILML